jgi:ATP-dependent helicase/nuclease subunit A
MTHGLNEEQRLAAECLDRPVLVTAGAGSGKTKMLAHRFTNAVVPGAVDGWRSVSVDDVLAITFTDKAAGEIGERIRQVLFAENRSDDGRRVHEAWISTIHGLCGRLLRRHPVEAAVDPLFSVADTIQAGRMRELAFEQAAEGFAAEGEEDVRLFDDYGYEAVFSACVEIVRRLFLYGGTPGDIVLEPTEDAASLLEETERILRQGKTTRGLQYTGTSPDPADHAERCELFLTRCAELSCSSERESERLGQLLAILDEYRPLKKLTGLEVEAAEYAAAKEELSGRVAAALVAPYARALASLAQGFSAAYARLKSAAGMLDFDDLQVKTVQLLEREPDLARRYRERFRIVMVDEFQDTDALQLRLVKALSDDNLCTVGDERQSIYRFRGADIDVYRAHRREMEERGALVATLAVNYRSHPDVLEFVNAVFGSEEYFGGGDGGLLRLVPAESRPTEFEQAVLGPGPRAEVLFVDSTDSEGSARATEARRVAERVRQLCDAGARARDVAILMHSYSQAHVYADALSREGVRAVIVGGSRFFGMPEIAIMRALNRVIANTGDERALGVLLASDFVPITSDALAILRMGSGERDKRPLWALLREGSDALSAEDNAAIERLVWVLESAQDRVGATPLADVLLLAAEEAGWDLRLLAGGNTGRDAFANVLKFARQANEFERTVGTGPAGFARELDTRERLGDIEAPATLADDEADAVRIMSVHASKGLEFPIVVVPELGAHGASDHVSVRTARKGKSLAVALRTPPSDDGRARPSSSWFAEFSEQDKRSSDEERARILYVAFTRARELLLASGSMKMRAKGPSKATNNLARMARILGIRIPVAGSSDEVVTVPGSSVRCRIRVLGAEMPAEQGPRNRDSSDAISLPPRPDAVTREEAGTSVPTRMSYTQLSEFERCPRQFWVRRILGVRPVESYDAAKVDPQRFGTALHAALRLLTGEGEPSSDDRIEALARYFELPHHMVRRLKDAVNRYAQSEVARRAESGTNVRRELPFAMRIGGRFLLTGAIDLYSRSGDSALVVDYKSGTAGDFTELAEHYRLQAECYGLAALRDGCQRVAVTFVRVETDDAQGAGMQQVEFAFDSDDVSRIEADLLRRYSEIERSEFNPTPLGSTCVTCGVPEGLCAEAGGVVR